MHLPLRKPIHHPLHRFLREMMITRRKELGLSQKSLENKLGVINSVIGKIETGDRRLDIIEFYEYSRALDMNHCKALDILFHKYKNHNN